MYRHVSVCVYVCVCCRRLSIACNCTKYADGCDWIDWKSSLKHIHRNAQTHRYNPPIPSCKMKKKNVSQQNSASARTSRKKKKAFSVSCYRAQQCIYIIKCNLPKRRFCVGRHFANSINVFAFFTLFFCELFNKTTIKWIVNVYILRIV